MQIRILAFDASQPRAVWWRGDWSGYLRLRREHGALVSTSLLRYRRSTVDDSSTFLEGYDVDTGTAEQRLVDFSHWASDSHSWRAAEDLEWRGAGDRLLLLGGASWEDRTLQKAYATAYGPSLPAEELDPTTYPFPGARDVAGPPLNQVDDALLGAYTEAKWRLSADPHAPWEQHLSLGVRYDHSSQYGAATTVRAGYVGTRGPWGFKALYGEGFQEPNPRVLYGGWRGSGSDPSLRPERTRTYEASATHTVEHMAELLSLWQMDDYDTIVILGTSADAGSTTPGARNLGKRRVRGLDAHWTAHLAAAALDRLELWAYYSHLFTAEEQRFDEAGLALPYGRIGDLAANKAWAGVTAARGPLTVNLRGRWVGERPTVPTNPVRRVDAFAVADLFVRWRLPWAAASVGLKATNLLDETYYEPGVRDASAGDTPGVFDVEGVWHGSGGFFDSLLPQPGREVSLVVMVGR
jgi:outer membrane receptor for ferrienterochelin and colicin